MSCVKGLVAHEGTWDPQNRIEIYPEPPAEEVGVGEHGAVNSEERRTGDRRVQRRRDCYMRDSM